MNWQKATLIESYELVDGFKSLRFSVETNTVHQAGQYYALRVESPEGYIDERHYSVANVRNTDGIIEFGVRYIKGGTVSPLLHRLKKGEQITVKGPFGKYFVWDSRSKRPVLFIVGGSGIVPVISMIETAFAEQVSTDLILIASFQTAEQILYKKKLHEWEQSQTLSIAITLTREKGVHHTNLGRINKEMIERATSSKAITDFAIYISGSTQFVEDMIKIVKKQGASLDQIKSERFG